MVMPVNVHAMQPNVMKCLLAINNHAIFMALTTGVGLELSTVPTKVIIMALVIHQEFIRLHETSICLPRQVVHKPLKVTGTITSEKPQKYPGTIAHIQEGWQRVWTGQSLHMNYCHAELGRQSLATPHGMAYREEESPTTIE